MACVKRALGKYSDTNFILACYSYRQTKPLFGCDSCLCYKSPLGCLLFDSEQSISCNIALPKGNSISNPILMVAVTVAFCIQLNHILITLAAMDDQVWGLK